MRIRRRTDVQDINRVQHCRRAFINSNAVLPSEFNAALFAQRSHSGKLNIHAIDSAQALNMEFTGETGTDQTNSDFFAHLSALCQHKDAFVDDTFRAFGGEHFRVQSVRQRFPV